MIADEEFKASVVQLILDGRPEEALSHLAEHFRVEVPVLRVGVVKGRSKRVYAVYVAQKKTIFAARREYLYDPHTLLHEFYHHLRYHGGEHRGTEKKADAFAASFIAAYQRMASLRDSGNTTPG